MVTDGSFSAHGDLTTAAVSDLAVEGGHLKIVYHKDGLGTHSLRFAGTDEAAENPYGAFVTPDIISWYELQGDGLPNDTMRSLLNGFDYGSAILPVGDSNFLANVNAFRPAGYPEFTEQ